LASLHQGQTEPFRSNFVSLAKRLQHWRDSICDEKPKLALQKDKNNQVVNA